MSATETRPEISFFAELNKETEHAFRFGEKTPKGKPPVSGGIYLKDYAVIESFGSAVEVEVIVRKIR